jgi:hypothetical protein
MGLGSIRRLGWLGIGIVLEHGIEELLRRGTGDPLTTGLQQQGELPFFPLAEQQCLPALAAPDAAVPEEEPPGPLELITWMARSHRGFALVGSIKGGCSAPSTACIGAALQRCLGPREEMPELHPQPGAASVGAEQNRHALGTAAALGVGGPPEGRHRLQRRRQGVGEDIGTAGLAQGLPQLGAQAVAPRLVRRPGGGPVLVVEPGQALQEVAGFVGLCSWNRLGRGWTADRRVRRGLRCSDELRRWLGLG